MGQWIGLFYLTVSDISAFMWNFDIKKRGNNDPALRLNLILCYLHCFLLAQSESSQSVNPSLSLSAPSKQVCFVPSFTIVREAPPILVVLMVPQCISQSRIHIGLNRLYTEPYQLHSGISQSHTDTS